MFNENRSCIEIDIAAIKEILNHSFNENRSCIEILYYLAIVFICYTV